MKKKKIVIFVVIILFAISIPLVGFVDLSKTETLLSFKLYPNLNELQLDESLITKEIPTATFKEDEEELIDSVEVAGTTTKSIMETTQKPYQKNPQTQGSSKTNEQIQGNTIGSIAQTQTKNEPTVPTNSTKVEHFERNNNKITEMENYIKSNPSETMGKFGYNIVHDNNIVNQTTGFTYTPKRIKDAIKKSFGTIKIYAHDYYVNGKFVETKCFIM